MRDTLALSIDRRGDIVTYVVPTDDRYELYILRAVDVRSNLLRVGTVLEEAALDRYTFIRDAHLQRRRAEIFDGDPVDIPAEPASAPAPSGGQPAVPPTR